MEIVHFLSENQNFFLFLVAVLSLLVGSFLNVVIHRLPKMIREEWNTECRTYLGLKVSKEKTEKINLYIPHSHCTHCKKSLKPWQNIPVVSYLFLRGRCGYCKAKISPQYPIVETLCCIASLYVAWRFGFTWQTFGGLIFTWIIIALTFIDLDCQLLPDQLTLLLLWIGLLLSVFNIFANSHQAIVGAIAGYVFFALIQSIFHLTTGKVGMGQGDYKFLAAIGAFLGWQQIPLVILLSSISAIIISLTHMAIKHDFKSVPLPFGPYLAIAGWITLIWGPDIINLYINKFIII